MYTYVALFHSQSASIHVQNSPMLMLSKPLSAPFKTTNATGGNPRKVKTRLQATCIEVLKVQPLSFIGTVIKHMGTSSRAPISAVAKLITDIRQSPVKAAAIVTDFK